MSATALRALQWMEAEGAQIARGLKRRDPEMLDRLIEQYQHRLLRYLVYLTSNRELAEDLFQETWIRVLERGAQYNGKLRFDAWLLAIARHLVIDNSRKKTGLSLEALTDPNAVSVPMQFPSGGPSPLEMAQRRQLGEHLEDALLNVDVLQRETIVLRFQEELSLEEIATVTGAPLSTVKSRLYRGLEALRPVLEESKMMEAHA